MTLLERDVPLRRLQAALEEAGQGRGATVLVSGEAGIGKTSLLQVFADGITGDWAAAAAGWERIGNPYHQALELTEAPDLEIALRGLGMLDRLGAVATASLVRRRLRRGGARGIPRGPRAATRANPGQLTDRQLEVLALLAEGSTNAEIAARLYLSRRTVDNHVASLLARLGVSSRHDALAVAADLGLLALPELEA